MKYLSIFLLLFSVLAKAATPVSVVPSSAAEYKLNRWMGPVALATSLGSIVRQAHTTAVGTYDYSVTGGADGDHLVGITLPNDAIIRKVFFDVITAPTTAGSAWVGFTAVSEGDLKTLTATGSWSGQVDGALDGAVANFIKTTDAGPIYAAVSGTLTAGKIKVYIDYVASE